MADDFNPKKIVKQIEVWDDYYKHVAFHPPVGSKIAAVYIQSTANAAEINAKLAEINYLADEFKMLVWTPTAEPGKRPSVAVCVTCKTDEPLE